MDGVFCLAGAGARYADQSLQRCFRELLGVPQPPQLLEPEPPSSPGVPTVDSDFRGH
ncbi:MAG: hypothetical protein JO272_13060 [Pseudonocardiales bacterium]|nr:hypothetical protein [Pseudonocardiales bacterium]